MPETPSPVPLAAFAFAFPQSRAQPRSGPFGAWRPRARRTGERIERHCLRPLLIQYLALLEGATAWVTGIAWTDAIVAWTSLGEYPSPRVTLADLGVCVTITLSALLWLALSGRRTGPAGALSDRAKGSREEVELFFATNALTFVVSWSWVVLSRDISTLTSAVLSVSFDATSPFARALLAGMMAFVSGPLIGIVAGCL